MTPELENLPFHELKKIAKENGINTHKMKAPEIIEAIQKQSLAKISGQKINGQAVEVDKTDTFAEAAHIKINAAVEPGRATPYKSPEPLAAPKIDLTTRTISSFLHPERINKVMEHVQKIVAKLPDGTATYDDKDKMIYLRGGPKRAEDITMQQPDVTIFKLADFFTRRMETATGVVGV